jgi:hypothetical protein
LILEDISPKRVGRVLDVVKPRLQPGKNRCYLVGLALVEGAALATMRRLAELTLGWAVMGPAVLDGQFEAIGQGSGGVLPRPEPECPQYIGAVILGEVLPRG